MKQGQGATQIVEVKRADGSDQAARLRRMAGDPADTVAPEGGASAACETLVLSPQSVGETRSRVARCLRKVARHAVMETQAPDQAAVQMIRGAARVVVAIGDGPRDLGEGLALVRWVAGQRLNVPLGVVVIGAGGVDRAQRRRLRATIEHHIGRDDIVTAPVRSNRVDRVDRRSLGRMMSRLQAQWHPVCGGGGL